MGSELLSTLFASWVSCSFPDASRLSIQALSNASGAHGAQGDSIRNEIDNLKKAIKDSMQSIRTRDEEKEIRLKQQQQV